MAPPLRKVLSWDPYRCRLTKAFESSKASLVNSSRAVHDAIWWRPPILINTMPKSGSIYLTRTVATSLEIEYSLDSLAEGEFAIMSLRLPSHTNRWRHNCVRLGI